MNYLGVFGDPETGPLPGAHSARHLLLQGLLQASASYKQLQPIWGAKRDHGNWEVWCQISYRWTAAAAGTEHWALTMEGKKREYRVSAEVILPKLRLGLSSHTVFGPAEANAKEAARMWKIKMHQQVWKMFQELSDLGNPFDRFSTPWFGDGWALRHLEENFVSSTLHSPWSQGI